jgi:hypothetical protein
MADSWSSRSLFGFSRSWSRRYAELRGIVNRSFLVLRIATWAVLGCAWDRFRARTQTRTSRQEACGRRVGTKRGARQGSVRQEMRRPKLRTLLFKSSGNLPWCIYSSLTSLAYRALPTTTDVATIPWSTQYLPSSIKWPEAPTADTTLPLKRQPLLSMKTCASAKPNHVRKIGYHALKMLSFALKSTIPHQVPSRGNWRIMSNSSLLEIICNVPLGSGS